MWALLMAVMFSLSSFAVAGWIWLNEPWLPMCAARGPLGDLGSCLNDPVMLRPAIPAWDTMLVAAAATGFAWTVAVAVRAIVQRRFQPADYLAGLTIIAVTTLAAFVIALPRGPQM